MTPELAYFLKINVAIALFYAFYRLFFYKDTFFHWRRTALLCFFGVSLLYPLLNIQEWIKTQEPMVAMADLYATILLPEQVVVSPQEAALNWQELFPQILGIIYWCGVAFLAIRFLIQLGSILRLHFISQKSTLKGVRVHILNKNTGPFSFFRWIFIHPESHTDPEISEIITHEETHVRQYHSVDVLISELMCIACWFNPFIWLMKREVRGNLEYMADRRVLETGHDSKSYQYHLLGLAHHKAAAKLSNSFNVLPLKNRIQMMNKRRTKEIGRTKYLMFLPLAALLMIVSNIEVVARTTKEIAKDVFSEPTVKTVADAEMTNDPVVSTAKEEVATLQDKKPALSGKVYKTPENAEVNDSTVFMVAETMPEFPGGQQGIMKFLNENFKYPEIAYKNGTQGRVIVSFVVKKDGSISNIEVKRGVDPYLDKEALRLIAAMPKWKPGTQRGKAVNVQFTVPVTFRIPDPQPTPTQPAQPVQPKDTPEPVTIKEFEEVVVVGYGSNEEAPSEGKVFKVVDEMPKFPGGQQGLMTYLARSIKYPVIAQQNKEEGRVIIRMVVGKDGNISNIKVMRGVSPSLDYEAIRVVGNMPKWVPGKQNGEDVAVEYTIPIIFKLQKQ